MNLKQEQPEKGVYTLEHLEQRVQDLDTVQAQTLRYHKITFISNIENFEKITF